MELAAERPRAWARSATCRGRSRGGPRSLIKPSGVPYDELTPEHIVPVSLATGEVVDRSLRPSSDTPTHLELYRAFPAAAASSTRTPRARPRSPRPASPVRCLGTTHADHFRGDVPVTRPLTRQEVAGDYERNTGLVIVETLPQEAPLAGGRRRRARAPTTARSPGARTRCAAVENARVLEYVARMEILVRAAGRARRSRAPRAFLVDKHYLRKHGKGAYYGQKKK